MTDQRRPSSGARTELLRTIRPEETAIPVLGHAAFAPRGRIQVGAERIRYDGVEGGWFLNCERGVDREEGGSEPRRWPGGTPVVQVEELAANIDPVAVEPTEADVGVIRHVDNGPGFWDAFNVVVHAPDRRLQTVALNLLQTGRDAGISFALAWGGNGVGNGQFRGPEGLAVDGLDGRVFVADSYNHRVQVFSADGAYLGSIGSFGSGDGQFDRPLGVAVNQTTRDIYVADTANHRVQRFNAAWAYLGQFGAAGTGAGQFDRPYGVAVDGAGGVWVADDALHRVQKFTAGGAHLLTVGGPGKGDGQFDRPIGVAVAPDGSVWVAEAGNHRLQRFDAGGNWLATIGSYGNGDGQFFSPYGVAGTGAGDLWVADAGNSRVQKLAPDGAFLAKVGDYGGGDGQFSGPTGIAITPAGDAFYVADTLNNRVQKFRIGSDGQVQFLSDGQSASDPDLFWDAAAKRLKAGVESGLARLVGGVIRPAAVTQRVASAVIANGTAGSVMANCLPGEIATGGGYDAGHFTGVNIYVNAQNGATGWNVFAYNTSGAARTVTAVVTCIQT